AQPSRQTSDRSSSSAVSISTMGKFYLFYLMAWSKQLKIMERNEGKNYNGKNRFGINRGIELMTADY
ncbi:MAG: hypothetical protein QGH39_01155, partial [Candidatus Thermoplasmatota archaeon]|nr:hypothetical protein [Candidatus Thermoplasmatota archaeon]